MRRILIFVGVVGLASAGQAAAQTAGVIQFVAGDVKVVQPGAVERTGRKGIAVSVGDTVATGPNALAQLKMGDGGIVVVQPQSRLTIAEYRYAGAEDGTERVRYRLEQGGFRAVTGAIGHTHKKNYVIETPIAQMGVRGTDHESYYFPATGPVSADGPKPGAYNKVNTGKTYIHTAAGEVEISPNQVGYVASATDIPLILKTVPGFFNRSIAPISTRPSRDTAPEGSQVAQLAQQMVKSNNGQNLVAPRGKPIGEGSGGALYGYSVRTGAMTAEGRSAIGAEFKPNGAMLASAVTDFNGTGVNWGTWQGGNPQVDDQFTNGGVHVISTTNPTDLASLSPAVTTASYSYAGGPTPTNMQGTPATIQYLNVGVDFSKGQITNYDLQVNSKATWNANGSGSISQFTTSGSGISLSGTCSPCTSPVTGSAHGTFVGPAAEGMITTFGLSSSGAGVSGAAYLKQ